MRICIDLDGVICQLKKTPDEKYDDLIPVDGAVEKINSLKKNGHYIIIYTARRMKTHNSNVGKIISDVGKITLDWLEKYGILYDEIYFGKPWAEIYIDDNALRFNSWSNIDDRGSNLPQNAEKKILKNDK